MLVVLIIVGIVFLDQVTKHVVVSRFALNEYIPVIDGFFDLRYVRNTGSAWGMLAGQSIFLIVISFVMLVLMFVYRRQFLYDTRIHRIAGALMAGGIIGNLIDRLKWGFVVDFLDFHAGVRHFPAFNVADSAICVGVGLYMLSQVLDARNEKTTQESAVAVGQ